MWLILAIWSPSTAACCWSRPSASSILLRELCLSDDCPQSMLLPCFLGGLVLLRAVRLLLWCPAPGCFMTLVKLSGSSVSVAVFREGFYFS